MSGNIAARTLCYKFSIGFTFDGPEASGLEVERETQIWKEFSQPRAIMLRDKAKIFVKSACLVCSCLSSSPSPSPYPSALV